MRTRPGTSHDALGENACAATHSESSGGSGGSVHDAATGASRESSGRGGSGHDAATGARRESIV